MENGENYEILQTNLQPFFWKKVKNIIRQNKKAALQEFLFGKDAVNKDQTLGSNLAFQQMEKKIQNLQSQLQSLQQKIMQLEHNKNILRKTNLNVFSEAPKSPKIDSLTLEQGYSTLKRKKAPYLPENDPKRSAPLSEVRNTTYQRKGMESKSLSDAPKIDFKPLSSSQQYNITSNQEKGLHGSNFTTLGKIPEQERIEIIQRGFQLQAEGKISLKKYYESTDSNSLFQLKGYQIKYETIRRTKLYQQFKPSNN
nr:hypothetical protein [Naviculales sp.]